MIKPYPNCVVIGEFKVSVESKGIKIRNVEMNLHLSGYAEICRYAMQTQ